jgi:cell division control protein 6
MAFVQPVGMHDSRPTPIEFTPEILGEEYLPASIVGREAQLKELEFCLEPATKGWKPVHCWLYGPPGSGKSTVARHMIKRMEGQGIRAVYVHCGENRTIYTVVDQIVKELRLVRSIERGVSFKLAVLKKYAEQKPLIVVLDEIHLMQPPAMAATLHALASAGRLGLVCISMTRQTLTLLDEPTYSRLLPTMVEFLAYTEKEILEMLRERASLSLVPEIWDEEILGRAAGLADGDGRVALRVLRGAALHAAREGSPISPGHMESGYMAAKDFKRGQQVNALDEHHQLVYRIIVEHNEILTPRLMEEYARRCRQRGLRPMSRRSVAYYLKEFVRRGWLRELPSGKQSGMHLLRAVG